MALANGAAGCAFDLPTPVDTTGNSPPTVQQMTAEPEVIAAGSIALITAGFNDPEGKRLEFSWSAEDGTLLNKTGPGVEWLAPTVPGAYRIDVVATDPGGLSDEGTLFIPVVEAEVPEPGDNVPVILTMTATPEALVLGEEALVEVEAMDPDGDALTYEWLMGIGAGDASGTDTTWAPIPGLCCTQEYPVGVKVRDGRGGSATSTVSIYVVVN